MVRSSVSPLLMHQSTANHGDDDEFHQKICKTVRFLSPMDIDALNYTPHGKICLERLLDTGCRLGSSHGWFVILDKEHYQKHEQIIARNIRQITRSKKSVRARAEAIINLIGDPSYPEFINIAIFTKKLISSCENINFSRLAYAYGQVIVLVTSKVPLAMDMIVAELKKACIYSVPKHVIYSQETFETRDAYYKALGYREEKGEIENFYSYAERLHSYMKFYGALVQTEIPGTENLHGISNGWTWLARLLNGLPANIYTAVALEAFLEMAGYMVYKKYGSQFKKILRIIDRDFMSALSKVGNPMLIKTIANIRNYIDSDMFLSEPEGWQLARYIESTHWF